MFLFLFSFFSFVFSPCFTSAQGNENVQVVKLENPLGNRTDISKIAGGAIKSVLGIVGAVALLAFVYGGFMWLTSAGSAEKIKTGYSAMLWAVIGLFIIFSSYVIINLIISGIAK